MAESLYLGTDLKILVKMEAPGFSMEDDEWEVMLKIGGKIVGEYPKAECIKDEEGNYYACVRGSSLKNGALDIVFHALVPDSDFMDDGLRNEYDKQPLATIKKI